jgi:hypothetical protein
LDVIKVTIAVHIVEVRSLGMIDEHRMTPDGAESTYRAIDTAREERLGLLKEFP